MFNEASGMIQQLTFKGKSGGKVSRGLTKRVNYLNKLFLQDVR